MNATYPMQRNMPVSVLGINKRARFITRTYLHLLGAVLAFAMTEIFLFSTGLAVPLASAMLSHSWLLVLGAFILVGSFATRVAHSANSKAAQYAALTGYVISEAIIFVPLLFIAELAAPGIIQSAALVTLLGFSGLTAVAVKTRKDFSFLASLLWWGAIVALVLIVAAVLYGFQLGTFFSVAMTAFAGGAILHGTSNVLHHHPEDHYVGAALELFASISLMFWYILRFLSSRR